MFNWKENFTKGFQARFFINLGNLISQHPLKAARRPCFKASLQKSALDLGAQQWGTGEQLPLKVKIPFHEFRRELARKLSFLIKNFNAPKVAKSCANTFSSKRRQTANFSVPYRRHNKQATIIRLSALEYSSLRIKRQDNWTSNLKVVF